MNCEHCNNPGMHKISEGPLIYWCGRCGSIRYPNAADCQTLVPTSAYDEKDQLAALADGVEIETTV